MTVVDAGVVTETDLRTGARQTWALPADPDLPGLRALVADGGRVRSYRPRRRALVELESGAGFAKVVQPRSAAALARRHEQLAAVPLVPAVIEVDVARGVVVLEPRPGIPLTHALRTGAPVPDAGSILAAVEQVWASPPRSPSGPAVRDAVRDARWYASVLSATVPVAGPVAQRALEAIEAAGSAAAAAGAAATASAAGGGEPDGHWTVVHGDFHAANVLVGPTGDITALVDLDRSGMGDPIGDVATMVAYLTSWAILQPAIAHTAGALSADIVGHVRDQGRAPLGALASRVAAALVGFATGAYRSGHPAVAEATVAHLDAALMWAAAGGPCGASVSRRAW